MATTTRRIGPADHGTRMTLQEFVEADWEEGWLYELARGVVVVTNVPGPWHGWIVRRVARLFDRYDEAHPRAIRYLGGGMESRLRLPGMQSDRHPDQAVYLDPIPKGPDPWTRWVPHLVVEVVSKRGEERDYVEKREEYLRIGVHEYWIVDALKRQLTALRRRGDVWEEVVVPADGVYRCEVLPGLEVRPVELLEPHEEPTDDDAPEADGL